MQIEPNLVIIEFDLKDRFLLRDLIYKHSINAKELDYPPNLESMEIGISGELAVYKWLQSEGLKVSSRTLDKPFEMLSDLHIQSGPNSSIRVEVKTSGSPNKPIISSGQIARIKSNSDYVIFCNKSPQIYRVSIIGYVKSSNLNKLNEEHFVTEDDRFIHGLRPNSDQLIPIHHFLTEIKSWRLI